MMDCPDPILLHGLADGELDAANAMACEAHVAGCPSCAASLDGIQRLRAALAAPGLRHEAPVSLLAAVEAGLEAPPAGRISPRWLGGAGVGAAAALAAGLALLFAGPQFAAAGLERQLVAGHVRSLLVDHLVDVPTSDRHVVKPWFNGKIDFAPPVFDLKDQGYPLVGGRLDYVEDKVAAVVVFRRRLHAINLFVMPQRSVGTGVVAAGRDGYHMRHWRQDGLDFWAVSDIDAADLAAFADLYARAMRQPAAETVPPAGS